MSKSKKTNKIVEVKEIKHDIKVKEISKESALEKDIDQSEQESFNDFMSSGSVSSPAISTGQESIQPVERALPEITQRSQVQTAQTASSGDTTRLYDIGRNLGSSQRRTYSISGGSVQGSNLSARHVGRDFALPTGSSMLPESQPGQFAAKTLSEERQEKYSSGELGSSGEKKQKRYAWEV
jgi:hypothetical protein